ncbi:MAG: hypothetical protein WBW93_05880 [Steroidobacteraceae bacterium]
MPPPIHMVTTTRFAARRIAGEQCVAYQALSAHSITMADGHRPAVDIQPLRRDSEAVAAIYDLNAEGLIELAKVDVLSTGVED